MTVRTGMSIDGDSRFILQDLGDIAGFHDVAGQSGYPRNVVNLEQIIDAPNEWWRFNSSHFTICRRRDCLLAWAARSRM